jgi:hypothetical protein
VPQATYEDDRFAKGAVSPDQEAIEAALPRWLTPTTRLLHVGVGSSDLARRYSSSIEAIDGVTVSAEEARVARSAGLANYRVWQFDKYGPELAKVPGPYQVVVDNNPGGYACCRRHFDGMIAEYVRLLSPGGRLVTHARGARWYRRGGIRLEWRHWDRMGRSQGLKPGREGDLWWWQR